MRKYYFYNNFHYGDCLVSLHFLIHLSRVNEIECEFSCNPQYHQQLFQFLDSNPRITLSSLPSENFGREDLRMKSGDDRAINLWCCPSLHRIWGKDIKDWPAYSINYPNQLDVGLVLFEIWKYICQRNELIFPFASKEDIIFDEEILSREALPPMRHQSYDFLLTNSYCHSNQVKIPFHQQDYLFEQIIQFLRQNNKTYITTQKLSDHECTTDYNLSLVGIAQLSRKCKVILGVPTSVFWITMNKWTMENCVKYINFTNDVVVYDFKNKTKNVQTIEELQNEILMCMGEI